MATVRHAVTVSRPAKAVWDAIADVGQLHVRVAPGMVCDTVLEQEGAVRIVSFANGVVLREQIISNDADERRLAWTAAGGPWTHHNASIKVEPHGDPACPDICTATWTADVLPHDAAAILLPFLVEGLQTMKAHLESQAA